MALTPKDKRHESQIAAGTAGRNRGHKFEAVLSAEINNLENPRFAPLSNDAHIFKGNPAVQLLQYIANDRDMEISGVRAFWLGGLATSGAGDVFLDERGNPVRKCKSDILLDLATTKGEETVGVSVKTCNKKTPTNDQMFFTTARAFCQLLRDNGIAVSDEAEQGLSMFCGDPGFRPLDKFGAEELRRRVSDPNRYYWEELSPQAQEDWRRVFERNQDRITTLLFQKAYKDDPYPPDYLLHQTVRYDDFSRCETAIFSIREIVALSRNYGGYVLSEYRIRKGSHKNDKSTHFAPRFGFIQFQRGGQKQHPTQLQFNLKAGYFRHI